MAHWLSLQPQVVWVEERRRRSLRVVRASGGGGGGTRRNAFAVPAVLGGRGKSGALGAPWLWTHGLRGQGEIVGVADTGVDYDSCFFGDAEDNTPGPEHRKIEIYTDIYMYIYIYMYI